MKRLFSEEERARGLKRSHEQRLLNTKLKYEAILAGEKIESSISPRILKRLLIERVGAFCNKCHLGSEWQGKPLTLELDHIDGDATNNSLTNLQLLCPNCHSQTSTYKAKNKGNSTRKYYIVPRLKK
jgi:hypothetical protein